MVSFQIIFKCGDDPRQDQLVIQLISLMDSLLKKVWLTLLHLDMYRYVLSSSKSHRSNSICASRLIPSWPCPVAKVWSPRSLQCGLVLLIYCAGKQAWSSSFLPCLWARFSLPMEGTFRIFFVSTTHTTTARMASNERLWTFSSRA